MNDDSAGPSKPLTLKIRIPAFKRAQLPLPPPPPPEPEAPEEYDESEASQSGSTSPISVDDDEPEIPEDAPMQSTSPKIHIKLPVLKIKKKEPPKPKPKSRPKLFGRVTAAPKPNLPGVLQPPAPTFKKPVKLKPLSELLPRLLSRIKKKDHYGIFLQPVDTNAFPAYLNVIKFPMDLSTMEKKLEAGEYASLEQFSADFRLMIQNCKTFNPSPSVYFAEASKLETFGNDAISQAAGQLAEPQSPSDEPATGPSHQPMDIDIPGPPRPTPYPTHPASPSVPKAGPSRPRSESIVPAVVAPASAPATASSISFAHAEWQRRQQPGSQKAWVRGPYKKTVARDVIGLGPGGELPGSYNGVGEYPVGSEWGKVALALEIRGKRYRTKKEKLELEKRGQPTLWDGSIDYAQLEDPFTVLHHFTPAPPTFPGVHALSQPSDVALDSFPITVSADRLAKRTTEISRQLEKQLPPYFVQNPYTTTSRRAAPMDEDEQQQAQWALPERPLLHKDLGLFQGLGLVSANEIVKEEVKRYAKDDGQQDEEWSRAAAKDGLEYIRDVVYGGTEGLAYSRSLMEFVRGAVPSTPPLEDDEEYEEHPSGLGMSLEAWITKNVLGPATGDLHNTLVQTTRALANPVPNDPITTQINTSLHVDPDVRKYIKGIAERRKEPIELSSLVKDEADLLAGNSEWDEEADSNGGAFSVDRALRLAAHRVEALADGADEKEETAEMRALRLNLLALARFVPLSEGIQLT